MTVLSSIWTKLMHCIDNIVTEHISLVLPTHSLSLCPGADPRAGCSPPARSSTAARTRRRPRPPGARGGWTNQRLAALHSPPIRAHLRLGYSNRYHHHCLVRPRQVAGNTYMSSSSRMLACVTRCHEVTKCHDNVTLLAFFIWSLRP